MGSFWLGGVFRSSVWPRGVLWGFLLGLGGSLGVLLGFFLAQRGSFGGSCWPLGVLLGSFWPRGGSLGVIFGPGGFFWGSFGLGGVPWGFFVLGGRSGEFFCALLWGQRLAGGVFCGFFLGSFGVLFKQKSTPRASRRAGKIYAAPPRAHKGKRMLYAVSLAIRLFAADVSLLSGASPSRALLCWARSPIARRLGPGTRCGLQPMCSGSGARPSGPSCDSPARIPSASAEHMSCNAVLAATRSA